jgi:hypothetical protein
MELQLVHTTDPHSWNSDDDWNDYADGTSSPEGTGTAAADQRVGHDPARNVSSAALANSSEMQAISHQNKFTVVSVMMNATSSYDNSDLRRLWKVFEDGQNKSSVRIEPKELLPSTTKYYAYQGSFSSAPCSERVQWFVLEQPLKISPRQLKAYRDSLASKMGSPMPWGNSRPAMPVNGRVVVYASFSGGDDSDGTFVAVLLIFIVICIVYYYTRPRWYNKGRAGSCCGGSKRSSNQGAARNAKGRRAAPESSEGSREYGGGSGKNSVGRASVFDDDDDEDIEFQKVRGGADQEGALDAGASSHVNPVHTVDAAPRVYK